MKPVFANYFMSMINQNGECVLNIFHNYPSTMVDANTKVIVPKEGFESEMVASIVMTHADAKVLADVLNTTLSNLRQTVQLANKQGGIVN